MCGVHLLLTVPRRRRLHLLLLHVLLLHVLLLHVLLLHVLLHVLLLHVLLHVLLLLLSKGGGKDGGTVGCGLHGGFPSHLNI